MRYSFVVLMLLMLLAMVSMMDVLAAPAPPSPSAILAIGPSPIPGWTDEKYRRNKLEAQTHPSVLRRVLYDPELRKLPLIARMKDPRAWLAKNLRVTAEDEGRRIRFILRAGRRDEQVAILNAFLRFNLALNEISLKNAQKALRIHEENLIELEGRLETDENRKNVERGILSLRTETIPETREIIARRKQITVIRWAR